MILDEAIKGARASLANDSQGRLPLAARKSIWIAMSHTADSRTAYQRRVLLESLCVRHVAGLWDDRFPGDVRLEQMLSLADKVVNGEINDAVAERQRDEFYVDVVEDDDGEGDFAAMFVGHAAANTVVSALIKDNFDAIPSVDDDDDLDAESFDPSFLCASAAAGGLPGHEASSVARRREFWTWYLDEAIRQAGWR